MYFVLKKRHCWGEAGCARLTGWMRRRCLPAASQDAPCRLAARGPPPDRLPPLPLLPSKGHMTACLTTFQENIGANLDNWDAAFQVRGWTRVDVALVCVCLRLCVRMCVWLCVAVTLVCACVYVCVCVCVCGAHTQLHTHKHTHSHTHAPSGQLDLQRHGGLHPVLRLHKAGRAGGRRRARSKGARERGPRRPRPAMTAILQWPRALWRGRGGGPAPTSTHLLQPGAGGAEPASRRQHSPQRPPSGPKLALIAARQRAAKRGAPHPDGYPPPLSPQAAARTSRPHHIRAPALPPLPESSLATFLSRCWRR